MKKSLFFYAAAAALMLTACSSEDDILQTGPEKKAAPQEVGFDVYTQAATNVTRAGLEGTMTTGRLQRSEYEGGGFGVYAFQVQDQIAGAGDGTKASSYLDLTGAGGTSYRTSPIAPNFMVNEKLLWNSTNQGWYYNPLKYWPNETDNDSQDTQAEMEAIGGNKHLDRLTFFAYAPYVKEGVKEFGITGVTDKAGFLTPKANLITPASAGTVRALAEPSVSYYASLADPNKSVDLLWGVAPSGGLTYTAVNGTTVTVPEGQPLIDMTKPDVNTNMKFLFQHALARINVKAVAAIDQVAPGGKLDPNTKITIDNISLTGYFGETGVLNLDNDHVNIANWVNINGDELLQSPAKNDITDLDQKTITIGHAQIAQHLQFRNATYDGGTDPDPRPQTDRVGVTTVLQNVLEPNNMTENPDWFTSKDYATGELAYSETTPYYTDPACTTLATAKIEKNKAVTKNSDGSYTEVVKDVTLSYPMELKYYEISDWYDITAADVKAKTYDAYTAYNASTEAPTGKKPIKDNKILLSGMKFVQITTSNQAAYAGKQGYTYNSKSKTYSPKKVGEVLNAGDYVLIGEEQKCAPAFEWTGGTKKAFYKRDANYFMVVPTNNISIVRNLSAEDEVELRKVRVKIEYYITTEDSKLDAGRAQTKNVIEKDVIFPSIANGKSYNLNLILGLTSVKMEAEVDDWKVINVNGNLPQNTSGE